MLTPRQGAGTLFHVKGRDDGLAGPVIGQPQDLDKPGGPYGAYVVERFTRSRGDKLDVYYLLSTWNPYTVLLMHTQLDAASR